MSRARGRRMALVGGAVIVALGGAFAVGAATSTTKGVAPARLAPAVGSAQPAALKLTVTPSVSVPGLAPVSKPKAKPKAATGASAAVVAAPTVTAPVSARKHPGVTTHTGSTPRAPGTAPTPPPVTAPATHSSGSGSPTGTRSGSPTGTKNKTSTSSGSGTVSGSG